MKVYLQPDGTWIDWSRHWGLFGVEGSGSAKVYKGEDAKILDVMFNQTRKGR